MCCCLEYEEFAISIFRIGIAVGNAVSALSAAVWQSRFLSWKRQMTNRRKEEGKQSEAVEKEACSLYERKIRCQTY